MTVTTSIAVFLIIWWTVLFAVLPLGTRTHAEMGIDVPGGGEPASPVDPKLKKKFFTTTWVAAILFAILWTVVKFQLIALPDLPTSR
ncbi:MAG: DUF1467 family protein [Caulobacteraceae bacterium]